MRPSRTETIGRDNQELAAAIAEAERADKAARALSVRKCWGEELRALEDLAAEARRNVARIRRRMLRETGY